MRYSIMSQKTRDHPTAQPALPFLPLLVWPRILLSHVINPTIHYYFCFTQQIILKRNFKTRKDYAFTPIFTVSSTPSHTSTFPFGIIYLQNEVSFNISLSVGLSTMNFLSFGVYENIFISHSFLRSISLDILCQVHFSFGTLEMVTHCLQACSDLTVSQ